MKRALFIGVLLGFSTAIADVLLKDEGTTIGPVSTVNCTGAGVTCSRSGSTGTIAIADAGPASDLVCTGCVSDSELANNYSGVGACTSGQFVTAVNDNAPPTCSSDSKGSYTFGGFAPGALTSNRDFAQYMAENDGVAANLNFAITSTGTGTTGIVEVYEVSSGTVKCTVNVTCTDTVGSVYFKDCNADTTETIKTGEKYRLRWNATTTCTTNPGGNATFVVIET